MRFSAKLDPEKTQADDTLLAKIAIACMQNNLKIEGSQLRREKGCFYIKNDLYF